jgi:hypothetical protein
MNESGQKRYKKGNIPWNRDLKGIHLSPRSEFVKEGLVGEKHPSWKGGIQNIKNDVVYVWTGCKQRARRNRKVYEENYGEIPKGYVIYHKNGMSWDDRPENLEAISRAELANRNREKAKGKR